MPWEGFQGLEEMIMEDTIGNLQRRSENFSVLAGMLRTLWTASKVSVVSLVFLINYSQDGWAAPAQGKSQQSPYGGYADWLTRQEIPPTSLLKELAVPLGEAFASEYLGLGEKECPATPEPLAKQSARAMLEDARSEEASGNFCEAAHAYLELRRHYTYEPYWSDTGVRSVIAYIKANDHIAAINEANDILDGSRGTKYEEATYLLMIATVYRRMLEHSDQSSQEWSKFLLGIEGTQTSSNIYLQRLSLAAFEEEFPESKAMPLLKEWKQNARDRHADYYFNVGEFHQREGNHLSAIMAFQTVLRVGPVVKVFSRAAYECVKTFLTFANAINDRGELEDEKLREIMQLPAGARLDRSETARATRGEAARIYSELKKNLPNDPWTAKAGTLLGR